MGEGAADTDTLDSVDGGGDGEGSVRRRLKAAAAFQREGEMLRGLEAVTDQATAASPNTGTSCLRIKIKVLIEVNNEQCAAPVEGSELWCSDERGRSRAGRPRK